MVDVDNFVFMSLCLMLGDNVTIQRMNLIDFQRNVGTHPRCVRVNSATFLTAGGRTGVRPYIVNQRIKK